MYTSPDDARSDLFLAGAVYLFGPLVLGLLLQIIPLSRIPGVTPLLAVVLPLVVTVLVPYLLIRYRREPWSMYGVGMGPSPAFGLGVLLGVPIVAASLLAVAFSNVAALRALPIVAVGDGALLALLARLATWLGLAGLAVYATVKARDAFRADYRTIRDGMWEIGRIVGVIAAFTTVVLIVAAGFSWFRLLLPIGVAGSAFVLFRALRGPSSTSRAVLLTPVVLLALGPFALSFQAHLLVESLWRASLVAGVGLVFAALLESRRSALGPIGLALAIATLSILSVGA